MLQKLSYAVFKTVAGWVGILGSPAGLRRSTLPQPTQTKALAELGLNNNTKPAKEYFKDTIRRFLDYFSSRQVDFPEKLDFSEATTFQRKVWQATRRIPYGQTRSYGWIARQIGQAGAARAVGQALGKNPLPIIVPCHRVLSSDGKLGGFSGGLKIKKYLLKLEKK